MAEFRAIDAELTSDGSGSDRTRESDALRPTSADLKMATTSAVFAQSLDHRIPDVVPALIPAIAPAPAVIPGDSGFGSQWHLLNTSTPLADLNVTSVWDDYTGNGVVVGVMDTGIDYLHPDLAPNYRHDLDYDARDGDSDAYASASDDNHGTTVAGVIAAALDGSGAVGVAPGADIAGFRIGFGSGPSNQDVTQFQNALNVDVVNNSWGYGGFFYDDFSTSTFAPAATAIENLVSDGRGGLGTVITFSAGNSFADGDNVNYHSYQNSPHTIAVGAIAQDGSIAGFSTPGAAVLVSAPGVNIYTTDVQGSGGYSSGDFTSINGTSFSSPAVAGVVALMLEANPDLGYRDVQEILAYSAVNPAASTAGWQTNGAGTWNGGGLTVSDDYGFGTADAHAAVRLAETWTAQSTFANLATVSGFSAPGSAINDLSTMTDTITLSSGLDIDHVLVDVDISHSWIGDLELVLTSPDGTASTLVDRPGVSSGSVFGTSQDNIDFELSSVQFWGEHGAGTWTLSVTDHYQADPGVLNSWRLTLIGDAEISDDTYIYTDQWDRHGDEAGRQTITDGSGIDTLNLAAVTTNLTLDLTPGATSSFFGKPITIDGGTTIENAFGGDGADTITGNDAANALSGMRGADSLSGGAGDDVLTGGAGDDTLAGGAGDDTAVYVGNIGDYVITVVGTSATVTDSSGAEGSDSLTGIENLQFADQNFVVEPNDPPLAAADTVAAVEDTPLTIAAATLLANDSDPEGDALTIQSVANAIGGTAALTAAGDVIFTPAADFNGQAGFDYTIGDGFGGTSTATVTVAVAPVNDAPVTSAGLLAATEDVLANGSLAATDVDGDALTFALSADATHGSVSVAADGAYTYTPDADYNGADSFSYTVSDGVGGSATGSVSIAVAPVNDAPVAASAVASTAEDVPLVGTLAATDIDGDALVYSLAAGSSQGSVVVNADGTYTYTPAADFNGVDSFAYTVTDAAGVTDTATISITVEPVNDAPVATTTAISTTEDTVAVGTLAAIDADGDALTFSLAADATHGSVTVAADGAYTFTPDAEYADGDSFTYTVVDAAGASTTATVAVTMAPVNDAPVAVTTAISADEDVAVSGTLAGSDIDGDSLTYDLVSAPAQGVLSIQPDGAFTFDPDRAFESLGEGETADVSFTYSVSDGTATVQQTATITVAGHVETVDGSVIDGYIRGATVFADANANGVLDAGEVSTTTDAGGAFTLVGGDGPLVVSGGTDMSTGLAFDGVMRAAPGGTVVTPLTTLVAALVDAGQTVSQAEAALVDALGLPAGASLSTLDPVAASLAGDAGAAAVMAAGIQIQNTILQAAAVLTGASALDGAAAFTAAVDALAQSVQANQGATDLTDAAQVAAVITAAAGTAGLDAAQSLVVGNAADEAASIISASNQSVDAVVSSGASGAAFLADLGQIALVAQGAAADQIDSAVESGDQSSLDAAVGNLTGSALDDAITAAEGEIGDVDGADMGTAGDDTLSGGSGGDALDGSDGNDLLQGHGGNDWLAGGGGSDTLEGGSGDDVYHFARGDGADIVIDTNTYDLTTSEQVSYTYYTWQWVGSGDEAHMIQVAHNVSYTSTTTETIYGDGGADVLAFAPGISVGDVMVQISGSDLIIGVADPAQPGAAFSSLTDTITLRDFSTGINRVEELRFDDGTTLDAAGMASRMGTSGSDAVTWTETALVLDGGAGADVVVAGAYNDTLTGGAGDDILSGGDGFDVAVYAGNVSDYAVTSGATATITDTAPTVSGDEGTDTLVGIEQAQFADRTLWIDGTNNGPVSADDVLSGDEGVELTISSSSLLSNDSDFDGDVLTIGSVGNAVNGTVSVDGSGDVVFTPSPGFSGTATFDYTASDGRGGTSTSTATVTVAPANLAPVTGGDTASGTEDTALTILSSALLSNDSDPDGGALTLSAVGGALGGTVSLNASGDVVFTPTANFAGTGSFTYTVTDVLGGTTTETVTVDITGVNDAPDVSSSVTGLVNANGTLTVTTADLLATATDVDGDTLSVSGVSVAGGSGSVADNGDGTWTVTPTTDWTGQLDLAYTVGDGTVGTAATASVTVNGIPVASADTVSGSEDAALTILSSALLANDTDPDGNGLTITGVGGAVNGSVAVNGSGNVVFTPTANFAGTGSFTYTISDGQGGVSTETVTVDVSGVNDAPVAGADTASGIEDTGLTILSSALLANDVDIDGDTLSLVGVGGAVGGTVALNGSGDVVFTPMADYAGTGSFTYTASDGQGGTSTQTVTVDIAGVNDAPVASSDAASTFTDGSVTIAVLSNDVDIDGDALTVTGATITGGSGGTVVVNANNTLTFDPGADFDHVVDGTSEAAEVTYTISDGNGGSSQSTVALTVTMSEDDPVTVIGTGGSDVLAGGSGADTLQGGDGSDALTGGRGSDTLEGGGGDDVYHFARGDGADTVFDDHWYDQTTTEQVSYTYYTWQWTGSGDEAQMIQVPHNVSYTSTTTETVHGDGGSDAIQFAAGIGVGDVAVQVSGSDLIVGIADLAQPGAPFSSLTDTVTIQGWSTDINQIEQLRFASGDTLWIDGTNNGPVSADDVLSGDEGVELTISSSSLLSNDSDFDGDVLTIGSVGNAVNGTVSVDGSGDVVFTPSPGFSGTATFDYTASDGRGGTSTSTATVTVAPANLAPVTGGDTASGTEDTALTILSSALLSNDSDPDGGALTLSAVGGALGGTVSLNASGDVVFTPTANFAGTGSFTYTVTDVLGGTTTETVTVDITGVNDAPDVSSSVTGLVNANGTLTVTTADLLATATDVDGDTLSVSGVSVAGGSGSVADNGDGTWTVTPTTDWTGQLDLAYTVGDGTVGTAATASVTVNGIPVASADTVSGSEDAALTILSSALLANDTDPDGNGLTITGVGGAVNGSVAVNGSGNVVFTPTANFAGTGSFTYTISDGQGGVSTETVTVDVSGVNDAPVAGADTASGIEDTGLTILSSALLANDVDIDGDTLSLVGVGGAVGGTVALNGSGDVVFTPMADYAGTGSFTYTASDGQGGTSTQTVTVDIAGVNDAPVASSDAASTFTDGSVTIAVLSNDVDIDGDALTVTGATITGGSGGTVVVNANNTLTFDPGADFDHVVDGTSEAAEVTYTISDGNGGSSQSTVALTVTMSEDDPVTVIGTGGSDVLAGGSGADTLQGGDGSDALTGGRGSDTLEGGGGDDVYHFARGDGADTVFDDHWYDQTTTEQVSYTYYTWQWTGSGDEAQMIQVPHNVSYTSTTTETVHGDGGSDAIQFAAGIGVGDVAVQVSGSDLIVGIADPAQPGAPFSSLTDTITIQGWSTDINEVEELRFDDGTVQSLASLSGQAADDGVTQEANQGDVSKDIGESDGLETIGSVVSQVDLFISAMAAYSPPAGDEIGIDGEVGESTMPVLDDNAGM